MSRLAQLPAGLSIYQLLVDHIDSHQALTGRRLDFQEAAISLDHWRGEPWHSHSVQPCGCSACVEGWASADAEPTHLYVMHGNGE